MIGNQNENLRKYSNSSTNPLSGSWRVIVLGIFSAIGYLMIAAWSGDDLRHGQVDAAAITKFLQAFGLLFICYWLLISPLVRGKRMDPRHLWFAIAFGLLFRAILLPTDLILENDIYRYMWDGHTSRQGVNPFRYAPSDNEMVPYRTEYWSKINYPHIPTIYPPTLQYIFISSDTIYPGSVTGMKFFLLVFDVGTIFILLALLEALKKPPEWCLIYAWSPLVIKEIANSGHADVVSAFCLAALMLLIVKKKPIRSSFTLAALFLTKFFGVLFLPLFYLTWRVRHYALFGLFVFLLYLPFLSLDVNPFKGFLTYSKEWQFNAGLYEVLLNLFNRVGGKAAENSSILARLFMLSVIQITVLWQTSALLWRKNQVDLFWAMFVITATLLLCSPVINTWYLVWLVPFFCLFPSRAWIMFSGLAFLSYTYYYNHYFPSWVKLTEFGIFFYLLFIEAVLPKLRWGVIGPWPSIENETEALIEEMTEATEQNDAAVK